MEQDDLLSTLRNLEPEAFPDFEALVLQHQACLINVLEDLKLKQSITNELLLELVEQGKQKARPDFGSQASPNRIKPPVSQIKRWNGKHFY